MEYLSLSEIAYRRIKEAILKHEIVPGQKLYHDELISKLGTSQTPIREALSRLAQEGYVTRLTNKGYRVSEMTSDEVAELFGLRAALECFCLGEVVHRITAEGLLLLENNLKAYKRAVAANAPLIDRYIINRDFHLAIARLAGNNVIYRALEGACEKLLLKRRIEGGASQEGIFKIVRHHAEILRAIKEKNATKAQEIVTAHLHHIKTVLIKQIEARRKITGTV